MDGFGLSHILPIISSFGLPGLVLIMWYFSEKSHERTLAQYRDDMLEQRQMYKDNVELVKSYQKIDESYQDVIIMNANASTKLSADIRSNQYCPMIRLNKAARGPQD